MYAGNYAILTDGAFSSVFKLLWVNKFKLHFEALPSVPRACQYTLCPHPLSAVLYVTTSMMLGLMLQYRGCMFTLLFRDLMAKNAVNAGPNENQGLLSVCITCQHSAPPLP